MEFNNKLGIRATLKKKLNAISRENAKIFHRRLDAENKYYRYNVYNYRILGHTDICLYHFSRIQKQRIEYEILMARS